MKVSLNWIKDYVDLPADLSPEQLSSDLTMRTVEVEDIENRADSLKGVLVGTISSVAAHPDADRLRVVQVDVGKPEELQIVCGGSNLEVGQKVVVAVPGSWVRWHGEGEPIEIKTSKLRGVRSDGMICAASEVNLEGLFPAADEHEIMDLTHFPGAENGKEVADVLKLNDLILEIDNKSMTNRPDLWGHYGLARELAAIYDLPLRPLPPFVCPADLPETPVSIEDPEACGRYLATVWEGVKAVTSPYWMQVRLELLGHHPRNLLVDLSNYVMLATGEPNHAFDLDCLHGDIQVRRAKAGEKLLLLDESELDLDPQDLLITSGDKAVGLAGIMGGKGYSIRENTRNMLMETAIFDPRLIRKMSQRHELRTDAEARFEKGIDDARAEQAQGLMQSLLQQLQPEARMVACTDCYPRHQEPITIELKRSYLKRRLGKDLSFEEIRSLLEKLGFALEEKDAESLKVGVPSWRATGDVSEAADLIEEIARMEGYENFKVEGCQVQLEHAIKAPQKDFDRRVREYLATRCALQEVYTYPWVDEAALNVCGYPDDDTLALAAPPSPEQKYLRPSLLPGLLLAAKDNERYFDSFGIFELSQVFRRRKARCKNGEALPQQDLHLGVLLYSSEPWEEFRRLKGIIEALPQYCICEALHFAQNEKDIWADQELWLDICNEKGEKLGQLAALSYQNRCRLGYKRGYPVMLELNISAITPLASRQNSFKALPQFPLVDIDLSLLCREDVQWSDIVAEIGKRVESLEFISEYRGAQVAEGMKSLAFRVRIGKENATLSAEEIEEKRQSLINRLSRKLGAEIRS